MIEVQAPYPWHHLPAPRVFLSGSTEMGTAEHWQARVEEALVGLDCTVLNPRRDDWDSSWVQSIENPRFREQVEWEIVALEQAEIVTVYFSPGTKSPITLLELGLLARTTPQKAIVCCPEGFWRKGNVDIVCRRYYVETAPTLETMAEALRVRVLRNLGRSA